jgi:BirA family biotin operon repressor/biotin-[acetyl-CoA-carboxylase] ligase
MDERTLRKTLSGIPLGGLRYFEQTGSTNDIALAWAAAGSPDLALVYAEEQTAGRGRGTRRWFTPAGAALAFSLVLRPLAGAEQPISLFSTLGALAVCEALEKHALQPQIKWPNDVLLNRRKVCGILAESVWLGEQVESVVLGVGLNIKPEAIPRRLAWKTSCHLETKFKRTKGRNCSPKSSNPCLPGALGLSPLIFCKPWKDAWPFAVKWWKSGRIHR